uniref:Transposase IS4-like domain-containing protein n=1 Tax=Streptomyces sp. WT6 TaxID=1486372 RepID=A0A023PZQ2_9ACTN|nr:hypothetical protein wt6.29c [Streptomyces sp. WT6]
MAREAESGSELEWSRACVEAPTSPNKGGTATGPSPVDRRRTGSKYYLICDGCGDPLHAHTTVVNANDITQTLNLVEGIPPLAGRPGRPRRRPETVLGDEAFESTTVRHELTKRCILPKISRCDVQSTNELGKLRYVLEQTFAILDLAIHGERRHKLHDGFFIDLRPRDDRAGSTAITSNWVTIFTTTFTNAHAFSVFTYAGPHGYSQPSPLLVC